MRGARLFAVCLLSLGVILQGYASVRVMDASCPLLQAAQLVPGTSHAGHHAGMDHTAMEHSGMQHDTSQPTAGLGPEHTGPDHGPGHGGKCQHGVGCQSVGAAIPATGVVLMGGPVVQHILAAPAPSFHSFTPPLLARPPALA
jgi:uncharacterized protein involved in copper resistance